MLTFIDAILLAKEKLLESRGQGQCTTYFDGLGRLVQTVIRQESPLRRDIIQPTAYDAFGRQIKDYLPYTVKSSQAGDYRPDALLEQYHSCIRISNRRTKL